MSEDELIKTIQLALDRTRIVSIIEGVIRNVCEIINIADNVTFEHSNEHKCITIKIGGENKVFPSETLDKFIQLLIQTLQSDQSDREKIAFSSAGDVAKINGIISISFDIGDGLTLKINSPYI